jgi:hypothetical protein
MKNKKIKRWREYLDRRLTHPDWRILWKIWNLQGDIYLLLKFGRHFQIFICFAIHFANSWAAQKKYNKLCIYLIYFFYSWRDASLSEIIYDTQPLKRLWGKPGSNPGTAALQFSSRPTQPPYPRAVPLHTKLSQHIPPSKKNNYSKYCQWQPKSDLVFESHYIHSWANTSPLKNT